MKSERPILIVEENDVDLTIVKRALQDIEVTHRLDVARNGEEALEYLKFEKPCIILLDLNMPGMNGIDFLKIVKQDDSLKMVPIVVLTTSIAVQDRVESFKLGVAGYMIKPIDYSHLVEMMRTIDMYWTLNELPG